MRIILETVAVTVFIIGVFILAITSIAVAIVAGVKFGVLGPLAVGLAITGVGGGLYAFLERRK